VTVALHHVADGPPDAPVLVLSGSIGSTVEMWRPQLAALTERFRVVRVDLRGHGGSPAPPGPYRMAELADDVRALLDRLDLGRVDWCGLSLGAMVGMHLASESPERIGRLVLCCTSAHFPDPSAYRQRIALIAEHGTAGIAATAVTRWFTPGWAAAHPDVVAEATAMIAGTSDVGYSACCEALIAWDHRDRLPAITAPTLVVAGEDDLATPVEPHARTLADGIPGARLAVVPGAHLANIETPDAVTPLLLEHLSRPTGSR
jgi:3-oxoadipate enol-lactonase